MKDTKATSSPMLIWILGGSLTVIQLIASLFLYTTEGFPLLKVFGLAVWMLLCIFGWSPFYYLRKRGGVEKGGRYDDTKILVTSGVYGIVRHPQYLSFILLNIALICIVQHLVVIAIGLFAIIFNYLIIREADKACIAKFGDEYKEYMKQVPQVNFVLGVVKRLTRR